MPFDDRKLAKRVAAPPCEWCGWSSGRRHAAHIIDEGPEKEWNGMSLCPNCAAVFDEVIRPKLYIALSKVGAIGLPLSWASDNKTRNTKLKPMFDVEDLPPEVAKLYLANLRSGSGISE